MLILNSKTQKKTRKSNIFESTNYMLILSKSIFSYTKTNFCAFFVIFSQFVHFQELKRYPLKKFLRGGAHILIVKTDKKIYKKHKCDFWFEKNNYFSFFSKKTSFQAETKTKYLFFIKVIICLISL